MHYYQFNIGDYHSHTGHLDPLEDIAYRRMIDWCYLHESHLPESVEDIARIIRMRDHCKCIASVLQEFFTLDSGGYTNARIGSELKSYKDVSKKRKKAANTRWANKHKGLSSDASALQVECTSNAKHEPRNMNQEPRTNSIMAKAKRFAKPTQQEVLDYCKDRGNSVEASRFIDHYESNGWKVGKNSMKCWKSAIRTWEKNDNAKNRPYQSGRALSLAERSDQESREILADIEAREANQRTMGADEPALSPQVGQSRRSAPEREQEIHGELLTLVQED